MPAVLDILPWLRLFDPVTEGDGILCFFAESPETYPARQNLLEAAMNCVRTAGEDRVGFLHSGGRAGSFEGPAKGIFSSKLAKKVMNAVLAEQATAIVEIFACGVRAALYPLGQPSSWKHDEFIQHAAKGAALQAKFSCCASSSIPAGGIQVSSSRRPSTES